ncbi:NAD-dependent epimerase/dehydratase family protein [Streptomonospora sp. S1-112]|uniref:NAD-dependent epimerase/dehydratase family protein n=1 Tax=Streptomonospora mangrovi TaxID=2883123 RepID=A0A9X3NIB4_9ACTN|nr:NAD-dependent epimerase/dehydratase family protein [Streptomonospora mangrovi]MDA0563708.1 NAD-dependent epimerase/dehydratase family protein [Streptomonospora mangrovi]
MGRVVLITGVSRYLGARVAEAVRTEPGVDRVVGLDPVAPRHPLGGTDYIQADLHDGGIGRAVLESGADTVVHLGLTPSARHAGGRAAAAHANVLGTMQLLDACQRSDTLRRLVVRSSAAVYNQSAQDPLLCTEDRAERALPRSVYANSAAEVEKHTRGLARRRPDLAVAVLRFANFIGPSVDTPLTRYFGLRLVPTVRGYDPLMQFIHEDDGIEAVRRMALSDGQGVFNVAGSGSLPLSLCLRRVGRRRFAVPEPGLRMLGGLARRSELDYTPEQLRVLCYDRVLDFSKLERALGWSPAYTSQEAFESYASERGRPLRRRGAGAAGPRAHSTRPALPA